MDFTETINDLIRENIYLNVAGKHSPIKHNKINVRCFICGDSKTDHKKKRGWFTISPGKPIIYGCWNDSCQGKVWSGLRLLCKMMEIEEDEAKKLVYKRIKEQRYTGDVIREKVETIIQTDKSPKIEVEDLEIPNYFHDIEFNEDALNVVKNRHILEAPYLPNKFKLYYSSLHKRIAIPWMEDGCVRTFQYRSIYKSQQPKYIFKADSIKIPFIVDSNITEDCKYIFTHEGVFDAIFMRHSIAVGGIKPTNDQLAVISSKFPFHVIVYVLDNPWHDEAAKNMIFKLAHKNPQQKVFYWPKDYIYKDINEEVVATKEINKYKNTALLESRVISAFKYAAEIKFKS